MRCAVLLRAVNVGGRGKLPMADLRRLLDGLGLDDVATYLQSGNVTLSTDLSTAELGERVERALADAYGLRTAALVRTADELAAVVAANPYPYRVGEPAKLVVTFLREPLTAELDHERWLPEQFQVAGREVYQFHPDGLGRSRMAAGLLRGTGAVGTTRNWTTVLALAERTGWPAGR